MAKTQTVSNEIIVAALLNNGTIKSTAAAVGISERTVYDRMNTGEFKALYFSAKADLIRNAVFNINAQLNAAINTVVDLMNDTENNPAVRLQAAQTIINTAAKFADRLSDDEAAIYNQEWSNKHFHL